MARLVTIKRISLGSLLLAIACRSPVDSEVVRTLKPATLEFYGQPPRVTAPTTVRAGQFFQVTAISFGGGCTSFGETRVTVSRLKADIRPHDLEVTHAPRNYACPDILVEFTHTATLAFAERGEVLIWFHGLRKPDGTTLATVRRVDVQ